MDEREAGHLTKIIKPKVVIPDHYNSIVGNKDNEKEFIKELDGKVNYEIFL